ncbi:endonuclease III domain-containing protein [Sphingomonas sp.]|uniref:endonuclease III domain-containing protein n=1 Tax=Sphingomonas sp. TaxID=28214 RepID=UPI003B3A1C1A
MQQRFDFASADLERWRTALAPLLVRVELPPARSPIGALVKSLISSRTLDAVSLAAYHRLCRIYPSPARLARATPAAIQRAIAEVAYADSKAAHLTETMALIQREHPAFDLEFLGEIPLRDALAWLERLPGVARKVAAATLNGSRLRRPVFIVDTHVQRVMQRLEFVGAHADMQLISEQVTAGAPHWSGADFLRFHVATKRLGQTLCRPETPDCVHCPLAFDCPSAGRV